MPIQRLSCDFNHLSIPIHLSPCRSHLCSRTSTEGAAVYTGCVGGGEAVPRRGPGGPWLGRPLRRLTVRAALSARTVSITPPPGHYEPGAVGLHRRSERSDRRAVSDRTAARRTSRTKNRAGRRAPGPQNTVGPAPWRPPPIASSRGHPDPKLVPKGSRDR